MGLEDMVDVKRKPGIVGGAGQKASAASVKTVKPLALRPGDTVGIVAPSGIVHRESLLRGIKLLEEMGLSVKVAPHVFNAFGYLAGLDKERADDFNSMWKDPEVKAVIAARGGYGAMRILPDIDFQTIRENPKIFLGYSDITALHLAIGKEANLVTFHAPMAEVGEKGMEPYNYQLFRKTLFGQWPDVSQKAIGQDVLPMPRDFSERDQEDKDSQETQASTPLSLELLEVSQGAKDEMPKEVEGQLIGGNLSLLASTIGSPWELNTRGKILFIEDVDEKPYRVDRMLCQLKLSGKLDDAAGFLVGDFTDCEAEKGRPSFTVLEVLKQYLSYPEKPCVLNIPAGHGKYKATLPLGVRISISTDSPSVRFLEPAVER